jgi:hypothetical protein
VPKPIIPGGIGAGTPLNPQKFEQPVQYQVPGFVCEEDGDWWAGAQKCFAGIAIASAVAATVIFGFPEQGSASQLVTDEDYWQNRVLPSQSATPPIQAFTDDDVIFPATITFQPDEDYYVVRLPQPTPGLVQAFSDDEVIANLHTDEDYWQNPTAPIPASLLWPQPFVFEQNEQAFGLHGQFDEDFWINPVAPVPLTMLWPQQWAFEQNEQATGLYGQPDEDFWTPQIPYQPWPAIPKALSDDDVIIPQPVFLYTDEDFWQNPTFPFWYQQGKLYLPDPEELPAASLYGQPDEDFWVNPVAPVWWFNRPLYLPDPEEVPAGSLHSPEEDYWQNPVAPVSATLRPFPAQDVEEIPAGSLYGQPDEDYWQNYVRPVSGFNPPVQALTDDEIIVPQPVFIYTDEDFWINPVFPVSGTLGKIYLPDPEEFPAGSLYGTLDEDFWTNPVVPVPGYIPPVQASADDDVISVPVLYTDEDLWQNPILPVWSYPVISAFSDDEVYVIPPVTILPPDEDFWQNPVAPVQNTYFTMPFLNFLDVEDFPPIQPAFVQYNLLKLMGCGT